MKFIEFLTEATQKDWDRMEALIKKGSDGESVAKSIKDKVKAVDRYVVGLKLSDTALVEPPFKGKFSAFGNRALELGATFEEIKKSYAEVDTEKTVTKSDKANDDSVWVPKKRDPGSAKNEAIYDDRNVPMILSIGTISVKSGNSKYFNIYEEWGEDTTYEIWKINGTGKFRIIATSGKKPIFDVGDESYFKSYANGRFLDGRSIMVDWATGSDLKHVAKLYGGSIPGFTYK